MTDDLILARGDGRHPRMLRSLGRADLLNLDDWGLEPLDALSVIGKRRSRQPI